ncbi:serine/arginine repetitive matrix protein 2-like [Ruditapes philippinarum]|uniref:serine/arginine repetitive matrix protein 2-like n=1 Tax=Ruditapes philippinarum TaxID=129788 RepID=UPI00295B01FE|nr:serine/arginine repetitive matrix protein 2-like [Ruditapes philippinarum]
MSIRFLNDCFPRKEPVDGFEDVHIESCDRTVQLEEDDLPYRKGSNATVRSEGTGTEYYAKRGMLPSYDSQETVRASRPISTASNSSMRVRRLSSLTDDNTRFPKLQDCAHFHYDTVDISSLQVCLCDEDNEQYHHNGESTKYFYMKITSNNKTWLVRRTLQNFRMLDQKLHRCIFDRKFSHLPNIALIEPDVNTEQEIYGILGDYLKRFSSLAGSMLNCGSVLNWLEIDNRGNRILAVDDSGINTPAIAAAHAVKRYTAQAADEISLEVGDIISVIDMPPTEDTIWWRGKRGFEVGFFPYECVEVIDNKVPHAVVSGIPETPQNRALLKKHGKFISFLRLFFNTRPARIQLKQSGIVRERVFGCDLGEHLLNSGHDVPLVLKSCADVIESQGLVDGIYRLSGITSNIQKLRLAFDEDRVPDLTSEEYLQDVHSISSLLKMYFRELPNPLLTYQLYDKFANAVKDEENKLLRIHDVVQQLPPPHYRTTEYLMRHLARVAAHGHETGMHSKNLAIVWAPNLLRSKELETGGGAAALQGVGIQAVVTEFLILYAEIIFSDKMPSYSSPELKKTHKKPRPKSLAISTPTRLLSLEEARERALLGSFVKPDQRYIDVGGGPSNLPSKYHTVLDLPGYKKKGAKEVKGKKSPGGIKSLFTKSRSGSIRQKGRKPSLQDTLTFDAGERKAITEEDVQHWKRRRIRSAKSAESLLSLPITSRLGSPLSESLDPNRLMHILADKENASPNKYRSMSVESPRPLTSSHEYSISYPSFVLEDEGNREMAIDVNPNDIEIHLHEAGKGDKESSDSPDGVQRKQSFIRNDQKRKVICHRRTPSAPTTPRHEGREHGSSCRDVDEVLQQYPDKSLSQPTLEVTLTSKPPKGSSGKILRQDSENERFLVNSLSSESANEMSRSGEDNGPEKRKGSKTPPKDRKKLKDGKEKSPSIERSSGSFKGRSRCGSEKENIPCDSHEKRTDLIEQLPESPGSRRKRWSKSKSEEPTNPPSNTQVSLLFKSPYFFSRYHDYAEINDDDLDDPESHVSKSAADNRKSAPVTSECAVQNSVQKRYPVESIDNVHDKESLSDRESKNVLETDFPAKNSSKNNVGLHAKTSASKDQLKQSQSSDFASEISKLEHNLQNIQQSYSSSKPMSKCISIPSDIQKSLENIHSVSGSHSDIMSSMTISELSMSQDNIYPNSEGNGLDRRRRSTSLDGLHDESPLSRTLREINAQIDQAFKQEKHKTQSLHDIQSSQTLSERSNEELSSELVSFEDEMLVTPTGHRSFGSMRDMDDDQVNQNKFVDRPAAEIHIADAPQVIKAPVRSTCPGEPTTTTPTRPSPPASLDIVSPSTSSQPMVGLLESDSANNKKNTKADDHSPYWNVPTKMGSTISEEDFQKILMSDPDSLKQFEQSMMYSPVRARSKGFPDGDRSGRSSVASPLEGSVPRSRSSRSSLTSPDASPGSNRGVGLNRSFGSPETSPLASRPPRNQSQSSLEASPQSRQKHSQSLSSLESSPQSKQRGKMKGSADVSPTSRQKLPKSYGNTDGSPHLRQKQSQSLSSIEASPPSRQKQNQSFSSSDGSPHSRQKQTQSLSNVDASPPSRQRLNQSFSSSEGSPQSRQKLSQSTSSSDASPRQRHNQSFSSVESSPRSQQKHNQSFSSSEASPQTGARQKSFQYGGSSPQRDNKKYNQSPRSGKKTSESPQHDRRSLIPQLKFEQRKSGSLVSSPLSPEHKQPRWEDLAGLNDSFNEIDMAVFNDNWKKCLAPTGDSIRLSGNASDSTEQLSSHTEPEVSTGTDTVVIERPSITRKGTSNLTQANVEKASAKSKKKEIETYDNVPEHEPLVFQHKSSRNEDRKITTERPTILRSQTMPAASSLPQSPVSAVTSPGGFLEHSSSFESSSSISSLYHGSSYESATGIGASAGVTTDRSGALRKSNTTPVLTRQTSFDSSYKTSVRVTSLGSSFEESDAECRSSRANFIPQGQGSHVIRSSNDRSLSDLRNYSGRSSHQSSQSSVLMRSESSQSADFPFHEISQSNGELNSSQSSIGTLLPQMLEEMDVNESCLGLASHQNMSNEMKEMMQEQMKEHAGVLSPLDEVMAPFPNITSPHMQQRSFFDTNPLSGFDMESSIEVPSDVGLVNLPEIHLQIISDGPVVIATPMVLSQLTPDPPQVHQPIDNTEEEFQNAVNDDLERNMANLHNYQPQHVSVCEPAIRIHEPGPRMPNESFVNVAGSRIPEHSPGLEHLVAIAADSVQVMDTPPPVMQDSMSSSTSSQVDLMSTSFTYPQNFDSWHYYSPMVNSLSLPGDLAPPPLEMIETCKSTLVFSKPKSTHTKTPKTKQPKSNEILITWEYPKILDEKGNSEAKKRSQSAKSSSVSQNNMSSERGEEKLVLDNKPSYKKSSAINRQSKPANTKLIDLVDSDHGENSASEDDVFVDPSEVTPETSFYAAGSKYFQRRDFLSYGHTPADQEKNIGAARENRVFSFEIPTRSSFDETLITAVHQRNAENSENDMADFHSDLMDIGHENSEDIRFCKAHRSSKLLTLCEKFEKETGPTSPSEVDESGKKKTITPPEKNIVSSIRQMHESLEHDGKEIKTDNFGKTQKGQKAEDNNFKSDTVCVSPTGNAPAGQGKHVTDNADPNQKSSNIPSPSRSIPTLQGKPPLCRTSSKTRTPSESSLNEVDNAKIPVKSNKSEGSPKSRYEGSPKGQRGSLILSEDATSNLLPHSSSPKGHRYSTEISPKLARGKEGPPVLPRHGGSPTASRSDTASKIPVFRQSSFTKDDSKPDQSQRKVNSSPKIFKTSWGSKGYERLKQQKGGQRK